MSVVFEKSSFRDRDGFVFYNDGSAYRAIRSSYQKTFQDLFSSDLYKDLTASKKLIPFENEVEKSILSDNKDVFKVYQVPTLPFISYPAEWNFSQLKKAALLTLEIQKKALSHNFSLKDASAYNVQFIGNKAIFIDSLSFAPYIESQPWQAYRQFCQHFLGPLLLMGYGNEDLQSLFIQNIDGIPLRLTSKLLPWYSKLNLLAYTHIHLHAKFETKHAADREIKTGTLRISKNKLFALIEHLEQGIKSLKVKNEGSKWINYYSDFSYSEASYTAKVNFIEKHLFSLKGKLCVDLGANTGEFSIMAAKHFQQVIACDNDKEVIKGIQKKKISNLLGLVVDLANPTPAYGWNGNERRSFIDRIGKNDLTLALALVHHLCIGNNIPLSDLSAFFANISKNLIIEFVPKSDPQVKKLLVTKKDIFDDYLLENFKMAFSRYFHFKDEVLLPGSERVIFLLLKKEGNDQA